MGGHANKAKINNALLILALFACPPIIDFSLICVSIQGSTLFLLNAVYFFYFFLFYFYLFLFSSFIFMKGFHQN